MKGPYLSSGINTKMKALKIMNYSCASVKQIMTAFHDHDKIFQYSALNLRELPSSNRNKTNWKTIIRDYFI